LAGLLWPQLASVEKSGGPIALPPPLHEADR